MRSVSFDTDLAYCVDKKYVNQDKTISSMAWEPFYLIQIFYVYTFAAKYYMICSMWPKNEISGHILDTVSQAVTRERDQAQHYHEKCPNFLKVS